jgi:hypothetical protein
MSLKRFTRVLPEVAMKVSSFLAPAACLFGTVACGPGSHNEAVRIELPPESGTFRPGAGADLANAFCLTCHSVDYISTQPPLGSASWKLIVEKMVGKYGAPIPPAAVDQIIPYLVQHYGGESAPKVTPK